MDILTVALLVIVAYALYYYLTSNLNYFEKIGVPYTRAWPLLGNTFSTRKHLSNIVLELYHAFPDAKYIGAFDLTRPVFMIRDKELIKKIAIKNFDSFPDHQLFIDKDVDPLFGRNLFSTRGDHWRETRNLISPTFTASKMKAMSQLIIDSANNFVASFNKLPDDYKNIVDTKELFAKFTNDAIASCAFGISIDSVKNPNNEFFLYCKKASDFSTGTMALKFILTRISPWLMKFFRIQLIDVESTQFFIDVVKASVQQRKEKGINRPDMIQLLMNAKDNDGQPLKLNDIDMTAQAMIFIFGGLGTTSSQMCVIAHEIALNDDIQKRMQAEIDEVIEASDGKPSYEMINKMPYLDAVFNESMRRHSPLQFLDRVCVKPFELPPTLPGRKPFTLQPGMTIWIPSVAIHRDPQYYENPDKFDPDRYYQKKVTLNDTENLSFGIGPRGCIGNRFAIMEIKILFFHLLYHFNLKPNEKTRSLQEYDVKTFEVRPEGGFWLSIEPRNRAKFIL